MDFGTNKSPKEVINEGAFGGMYFISTLFHRFLMVLSKILLFLNFIKIFCESLTSFFSFAYIPFNIWFQLL